MNENHVQLCTGPQWAEYVQTAVLPIVTRDVDLGSAMLEIGPVVVSPRVTPYRRENGWWCRP